VSRRVSRARRLCALATLADGRAALVGAAGAPAQEAILLVRRGDRVAGFVNECPHMGLPLDWKADRLALGGGAFLRCSHHGALFQVDDGVCVAGPCVGESLRPVTLRIVDGVIMLAGREGTACRA
jgi:nitrite reductase/ring-hydroxylating ferredoxin subunit